MTFNAIRKRIVLLERDMEMDSWMMEVAEEINPHPLLRSVI